MNLVILSSIPRYPRIAEIFGGVGMFRLVFFSQISLEGCSPQIFCRRCTQFDSHVFQWDCIQIFVVSTIVCQVSHSHVCFTLFFRNPTYVCVYVYAHIFIPSLKLAQFLKNTCLDEKIPVGIG